MSKPNPQPHVIVTVGKQGNMLAKSSPETYTIEAYGYTMPDVEKLFDTVHNLVRPTEADPEELGNPFQLGPIELGSFPLPSGFRLVMKGDPSEGPRTWSDAPRRWMVDQHHTGAPDELETCGCATSTDRSRTLMVRVDGVNHRFQNFPLARKFALRFSLTPQAVFAFPVDDERLCCFPYAFQLADGTHMGFQTEAQAEYMAGLAGLDISDVTYHADVHEPEHQQESEAVYQAMDAAEQSHVAGADAAADAADAVATHPTSDDAAYRAYREENPPAPAEQPEQDGAEEAIPYALTDLPGVAAPAAPTTAGYAPWPTSDAEDDAEPAEEAAVRAPIADAPELPRRRRKIPAQRDDEPTDA